MKKGIVAICLVAILVNSSVIIRAEGLKYPILIVESLPVSCDSYFVEQAFRRHDVGARVHVISLNGYKSFKSLWEIVEELVSSVQDLPELREGFYLIATGMSGLIARGYVQKYNDPVVRKLITFGTPHSGVRGICGFDFDEFLYGGSGLDANMRRLGLLTIDEQVGEFIAQLNNEVEHEEAALFRKNIASLERLALFMPTHLRLLPTESCWFGDRVLGIHLRDVTLWPGYQEDSLGLRELAGAGRLFFVAAPCEFKNVFSSEDALSAMYEMLARDNVSKARLGNYAACVTLEQRNEIYKVHLGLEAFVPTVNEEAENQLPGIDLRASMTNSRPAEVISVKS